jgi:bleomycin hydrolase
MLKRVLLSAFIGLGLLLSANAQEENEQKKGYQFEMVKEVTGTAVNNQQRAGTCWSYSSIGMIEAEMLRLGKAYVDL